MVTGMAGEKQIKMDAPAELAQRLVEGLQRERIVPRFVDSYVVDGTPYRFMLRFIVISSNCCNARLC